MIVETTAGKVRGKERGGVATWRGIPYATARRFRAPEPPAPWTGERDALEFGPFAHQARDPRSSMMSGVTEKTQMSEDCLVLNVYAPLERAGRRPVVVWIHGGAFIMGAGSQPAYNGTSFVINHDIVVVTINYRLGVLGLLDRGGEGNYTLLDQIAALRWVKGNIAAFGGDPDNVTIMGESAGAISVAHLLAMPAARGLFHRAILQSGAAGLITRTREDAAELASDVAGWLGVSPAELETIPVERILAAQRHQIETRGLGSFAPYVDGISLPRAPLDAIRDGSAAGVSVVVGSNKDEWSFFDVLLGEKVTQLLVAQIRGKLGPSAADAIHARYLAARSDGNVHAAWVDLVGDLSFRIPAIRLADTQRAHAPVWMYRFDWRSPLFDGRLGAAHALELPFVWNVVDTQFAQLLLGGDTTSARPLATVMHDAWASFIKTGAPATTPAWPRYDERRTTMLFDRELSLADDPGAALRVLWP